MGEELAPNELPMWVYEHVLASHYGWSLTEIRQMDLHDFFVHLRICLVREDVEREFKVKLAGASLGVGGETAPADGKEQITKIQKHRHSTTETSTKSEKLRNEIGSLRLDKRTGKVVSFNQPELPDNV
ncbi:MAG: hypothetical protein ACXAC5_00175 [Promethearchaeota archaeon]|jgi:hypothetical protein